MMRSATAFLPDSITTFMNLDRSTEPNFGSGRISRLGTSRRRGMVSSFLASVGRGPSPGGSDGTVPDGEPRRTAPSTYSAAAGAFRAPVESPPQISSRVRDQAGSTPTSGPLDG